MTVILSAFLINFEKRYYLYELSNVRHAELMHTDSSQFCFIYITLGIVNILLFYLLLFIPDISFHLM